MQAYQDVDVRKRAHGRFGVETARKDRALHHRRLDAGQVQRPDDSLAMVLQQELEPNLVDLPCPGSRDGPLGALDFTVCASVEHHSISIAARN
jgi:hypothetical protein